MMADSVGRDVGVSMMIPAHVKRQAEEVLALLKRQAADIQAAADAEIAKIRGDHAANLAANAAQQAEAKAQMAKES